MRFVANIDGQTKTEKFVAYLLSQNISAHIEKSSNNPSQWEVWVRDEDRLADARNFLGDFENNPDDVRYGEAVKKAEDIVRARRERIAAASRNTRTSKDLFRNDLVAGKVPPITKVLLAFAVVVTLITGLGKPGSRNEIGQTMLNELMFVSEADYKASEGDPLASIRKYELWRVITPIFLHFDFFHILFNAFMLVSLGRMTERLEGSGRFAILVLVIAIFSNCLQGILPQEYMGSPFFGGLSGVVYGLFGFIWVRTTLNPSIGIALAPMIVVIMLAWLFLNMTGTFGGDRIANMAHLGGLISGAFLGFLAERTRA